VIEATSGNTGIGLAMVCARKGYPLVVTMAESFSVERRKMLRFLGAKVVLTPASEKGTGMLNKAIELAEKHGWYLCRQFENEANADVHSKTTAQEIIADFEEEPLHYFVSGFGTGGTLKGVARALKAWDAKTRVVAAEPDNAQLLGSGIAQPRGSDGSPSASHPSFRPHLMQGWSPDFVSKLTDDAMTGGLVDEVVPVSGSEAMKLSRELARKEGIFVGTSSGATLAAALEIARRSPGGTNIVCMLPDTGERYMSTPLFEEITEEMTEEETAISRSTPRYRFDAPPAPAPKKEDAESEETAAAELDADAERFVRETVAQQPVVLFALEWCEFCWSARKFFSQLGIDYYSVDLDSVEYQEGDRGGKIRAVLAAQTGAVTIPQIFIGGDPRGSRRADRRRHHSPDLHRRRVRGRMHRALRCPWRRNDAAQARRDRGRLPNLRRGRRLRPAAEVAAPAEGELRRSTGVLRAHFPTVPYLLISHPVLADKVPDAAGLPTVTLEAREAPARP
jgi:cysteine synthase A